MSAAPRIVRSADLQPKPWKNGGGDTREIAVAPAGADAESFDWRVSMATVASDGPFSVFPGVDRTLTVIDGNGLILAVEGRAVTLRAGDPPFRFPADVDTTGTLLAGQVTDLNVMTHRDRFAHRVRLVDTVSQAEIGPDVVALLVVGRTGAVHLGAAHGVVLAAGDTAWFEAPPARVHLDGAALLIEIVAIAL